MIASRYTACITCKHLDRSSATLACAAFPGGVPEEIAVARVRHDQPYPGDNGIRYEMAEDYRPPRRGS
jgi:hypothetical protein